MESTELGIDAYDGSYDNNGELLKNLEGCSIHRFSPGTGEHAGTALMVVELPTGEGLGVQVDMKDGDDDIIKMSPVDETNVGWTPTQKDALSVDIDSLRDLDEPGTITEVIHHEIMNPEQARVLVILTLPEYEPALAVDIYLHETGGTDFFEVEL